MAIVQHHENGALAMAINDDMTGFIYYPNGAVAVCISPASDYQNRCFAFDKDRKNSVLLAIDEHFVGVMSGSRRKTLASTRSQFVSSQTGALVTNPESRVIYEWKWDEHAQNAGTPPTPPLHIRLNEHLSVTYNTRIDVHLDFSYNTIKYRVDLGVKERRTDSYLDHAKRGPGGKLIPQIERCSLDARQRQFNESMRAQRNKLHPRSENLSDMVSDIVARLESNFDNVSSTIKMTQGLSTWKSDALSATLKEIPRIPIAGTELGPSPGFSTTIYAPTEELSLTKTVVHSDSTVYVLMMYQAPGRLLDDKGHWKGSLEIRTMLRQENPPLARSATLCTASGRYSSMLVVDKSAITADNPTGMVTPEGTPLENMHWHHLKQNLSNSSMHNTLVIALVLRGGDPQGMKFERVAEIVNGNLRSGKFPKKEGRVLEKRLIRIDVSENNDIISEFGIKAIPTFLAFYGEQLVYAGGMGGRKVKIMATGRNPQVLLIEPNFTHQIDEEKVLRQAGCDVFLCLSVGEAVSRIRSLNQVKNNSVVFDLVLISEDATAEQISALSKVLAEFIPKKRSIVSLLVSVLGQQGKHHLRAVPWTEATSDNVSEVSPNAAFTSICSMAMQKPIKGASVRNALARRIVPHEDANFGLTPQTMMAKISQIEDQAHSGSKNTINYIGIRLSAEDTRMRGTDLISSTKK